MKDLDIPDNNLGKPKNITMFVDYCRSYAVDLCRCTQDEPNKSEMHPR